MTEIDLALLKEAKLEDDEEDLFNRPFVDSPTFNVAMSEVNRCSDFFFLPAGASYFARTAVLIFLVFFVGINLFSGFLLKESKY